MDRIRNTGAFHARNNTRTAKRTDEREFVSYFVMTLSIILFSLPVPLSVAGSPITKGVCWAVCLVCAALTMFTSRKFSVVILVSLALTFILSYLGDPTLVAVILGTVFFCGLYSASVASAKGAHILFVVFSPILASAASYALTGSVILSFFPAMLTLPSLSLGISTRRLNKRAHSMALFTAVCIAELAAAVITYVFLQNHTLTSDVIEHAVEYLRGGFEWSLKSAIVSVGATELSDALVISIREMATLAVNYLPGAITVIFLTLSFFVQKIAGSLFDTYEKEKLLNQSAEPISVSSATALVFLASHVLSYTSGASYAPSFIAVVSGNLSLILLPALLCIGFRIMGDLPKKIGFLAVIIWIVAVIIANALSASILTVLALIGAFYIILVRTDAWAKDHYAKKGEDQ